MKKTTNLSSQGDCNQRVLELHAQYAAELQAAKYQASFFLKAHGVNLQDSIVLACAYFMSSGRRDHCAMQGESYPGAHGFLEGQ